MTFASIFQKKIVSSDADTKISDEKNDILSRCKNSSNTKMSTTVNKKNLHQKFSSSKRDPVHFHERKMAHFRNNLDSKEAQSYLLASFYSLNQYVNSVEEADKERYRNMFFKKCHPLDLSEETQETKFKRARPDEHISDAYRPIDKVCPECSQINCNECGVELEHNMEVLVGFNERKDYLTTTQFVYQRFKSIHDLLREIQGLQKKEIDDNHFQQMKTLFEDYVATQRPQRNINDMTATDLFKCLKQEKRFSDYYDVIPTLLTRLTNRRKKIFTSKTMKEIEAISHKVELLYDDAVNLIAPERKAFFNTRYLTAKLLERVGEHEALHFIYEMKCPKKKKLQDAIWNEIQKHI